MEHRFITPLRGAIVLTDTLHSEPSLLKDKSLYKFIWVREGTVAVEIDHVESRIARDEIISLTPLHRLCFLETDGVYEALLFNSNFYCIYGHDDEVSCSGLLFNGTSTVMKLKLAPAESAALSDVSDKIVGEYSVRDNLREEMLRILLKRFIITCTRIARERFCVTSEKQKGFDIVRRYYVLVDNYFREKKQVQDYAHMLHRSPKTLSNLFASYGLASPLRIIHERLDAEAKRLLLYSAKSAKEIASILGFEDTASFSRFFKNMEGESITEYRARQKRE